jgi:ABC-2 type transport system ATP-binding protein
MLGPNGAGKTTTVEILVGARRATSGEVRVLGQDPAQDQRQWRARIGIVPQSQGAFADLTVHEVVRQFAAFYPHPLPVDQIIEMVGLTKQARKQATALSGGQQRRLDVAVGAVGDPDLLFLDEPTTGLDPVARREAWDLVRHFAAQGKTAVLTTHYLDEAEALADRVAIIIDGRVVEVGPVGELGGWNTQATTVSFTRPQPLAAHPLPDLPDSTEVAADADEVVLVTQHPTATLHALIGWAHGLGLAELPGIRVHRPTLEEIYLDLVDKHSAANVEGAPEAITR